MQEESIKNKASANKNQLFNFLFWGLRYYDILLFLAFPFLGALFAVEELNYKTIFKLTLFIMLNLFLNAYIFLFNDIADAKMNPNEPVARSQHALKHPELISPKQILIFAFAIAFLALAGLLFLSKATFLFALFSLIITTLYSYPRSSFKKIPVAGDLAHFSFAVLYFLSGYSLFSFPDNKAFLISFYFGLILPAGYLVNQIEHFPEEFQAGLRTSAIFFGQRPTFHTSLWLFILSSLYLVAISLSSDSIPNELAYVGFVLFIIWLIRAYQYREWRPKNSLKNFRFFYRILYAIFTISIGIWLIWTKK